MDSEKQAKKTTVQNKWLIDEHNYLSRLDKFLRNALKNVPLSAIYKRNGWCVLVYGT